ncbi:MAG TPA: murein biosynthesis integral membrane protein MurJ [Candidatus Angelobacter sp.]|nr:murein biosynthesis integral membrane protein MurJ [Candidatus Angelobacter sp.]
MAESVEIAPLPSGLRTGHTAGIVGALMVLVSAIGYLREAALASRFGVSATMDAYFGAVFIPNILYSILIAGTVSPILIRILVQEESVGQEGRRSEAFSIVMNFSLLVLILIISVALPGAHLWLPWLFPGFNPATLRIAVHLVNIILPAVIFLAGTGILTAVLNGCHKFALASFAPATASAAVITAVLFAQGERAIYVVGIATAVGFLLQFLVLVPAVAALGIRYRPIFNFRHPVIARLLRLGIPLFLYLAVAGVSSVMERNLASRISAGAVSTLSYALRLFTVPSNFMAAPLAIVAYPGFAREAARARRGELGPQLSKIFRLVIFLFLPVTIWTVTNSLVVTRLLYEHGLFLPADSVITAHVLAVYSVGILPNAIAMVLLRCFFAVEDTVTPLVAEILALISFVTAAPVLSRHFGLGGLVAARAVAFFLVTGVLIYVLARRQALLNLDWELLKFLFRALAASLGMGAVSWLALRFLVGTFDAAGSLLRFLLTTVLMAISAATYLFLARLLNMSEARQIWSTVRTLLPSGNRSLQ